MNTISAHSGYHNLNLNKKISVLNHICMSIGSYKFTRLPFGTVPAGDMFQQKINEIFKDLPNVFGIADGILMVGYDADGRDHNTILKNKADMPSKKLRK